jgi:Flp pilus assembly protein TadD
VGLAGAAWLVSRLAAQNQQNGKGARDLSVSASEQTAPEKLSAGARRRMALLIGNNQYSSAPRLQNAVNDAADLGRKLTELGFTVNVVTDGTLANVNTAISRYVSDLRPGDISLFFYAGHGVQSGGENYLIPVEFQPSSGEASLPTACIGASSVLDRLQRCGPELNLMILDACRNNPFHPGANVKGLAVMEAGLGACIALSTGPGQTAADNPHGRNGLFSGFLLANIETPGQSLDSLLKKVKLQVYDASGGIQRPWMFADTLGDFFFRPVAQITLPRGGVSDSVEAGKQFLQRGQYEEAVASFERALRLDPENPFIYNALGAARSRLRQWSIAVSLYAKAIDLRPDYATAYFNRGIAYYNAARYELAVQDFSWAIEQEPYDPRTFDLRGRSWLSLRQRDEAMADFDKALQLDPSDAVALLGRGKVFFQRGEYSAAVAAFTASIRLRPAAETYEARAQVYRSIHDTSRAEADEHEAQRRRNGR